MPARTYYTLIVKFRFLPRCDFLLVSYGNLVTSDWFFCGRERFSCLCRKSSLVIVYSVAPLVKSVYFPSYQLVGVDVIPQECGSCVVYWVTVVSAVSFCVSNSVYFVKLSNFKKCIEPDTFLACYHDMGVLCFVFSVCKWVNFAVQLQIMLLCGS